MLTLRNNKSIEESRDEFNTIQVRRKKTVAYDTTVLTSISAEKVHSYHGHHKRSTTSKNKLKKVMMIDASQPPALERPSSAPLTPRTGSRPKNFRVRVYRNGDDSICAYCASCSMDIILTDATYKLQMIRPARRLFDSDGYEIFRSDEIQRDMEYYVSDGDDFISPLEAIKAKLKYRLQSRWTLYGIESTYIRTRPRRRKQRPRPTQRSTSINGSESSDDEVKPSRYHDNKSTQAGAGLSFDDKDTQTTTKCDNKYIQTDRKVAFDSKNTQTTTIYQNKDMQTDGNISLDNKNTQTTTECANKDIQTDGKLLLDTKDTQTTTQCEDKDIQTDVKISLDNKNTQTIIQYTDENTQTDDKLLPVGEDKPKDEKIPPDNKDTRTTTEDGNTETGKDTDVLPHPGGQQPGGGGSDNSQPEGQQPSGGGLDNLQPREQQPGGGGPDNSQPRGQQPEEYNQTRQTGSKYTQTQFTTTEYSSGGSSQKKPSPRKVYEKDSNRTRWGGRKSVQDLYPREATPTDLSVAIYRRNSPKTNFRVKVYRNGERDRYEYCKSCSMDTILSAATEKLQMSMAARRLFHSSGTEIFRSREIERDEEYYASSGENFIPEGSTRMSRSRSNLAQTELNTIDGDHTRLVRRELIQKQSGDMRISQTMSEMSTVEPLYRRSSPTTNFRVKVYRNGERGRFEYCKSCSMDIILSAASEKLQMPMPAKRLFDSNGVEIFDSKEIRRGEEYYVSSGGNFKQPVK